MKNMLRLGVFGAFFWTFTLVQASENSWGAFSNWLKTQKGIDCKIEQKVVQIDGEEKISSLGLVADKEGQFKLVSSDLELWSQKKFVWEYRVKAKQVLKKSNTLAKSKSLAQTLWDVLNAQTLRSTDTILLAQKGSLYQIKVPTSLSQVKGIEVFVSAKTQKPVWVKITEKSNQIQELQFLKLSGLKTILPKTFDFKAPRGVQEIEL